MSDQNAPLRQEFLQAMRQVASTVSVVTTGGSPDVAGATVSSFCSVSADPPALLVCLREGGRIGDAVAANGTFCINILPENAPDIARRFAAQEDPFSAAEFEPSPYGPVLPGATAFMCALAATHRHGSHRIFIGNVAGLINGDHAPLTYMQGGYHKVRRR